MTTQGAAPWERRPDEGSRAYAAFLVYRDQPPYDRSLRRLAGDLGRNRQHIGELSSRYGWVERVTAWDAEQERLLRVRLAEERAALARRLAAAGALMQSKGYPRSAPTSSASTGMASRCCSGRASATSTS